MPTQRNPIVRRPFAGLAALSLVVLLAACGPAASSAPTPPPSARPTPTPIAPAVGTPEEAAARVIAVNPLFAGAIPLTPDVIGASKWWTAAPLAAGGYTIELTVGWGECPAGCIERHVWTFEVQPDGAVKLVKETGEPVPATLPD
jgi:hypothetical protein